jgi:hypothetical protein
MFARARLCAVDVDDGLAGWRNRDSGLRVKDPGQKSAAFLARHDWAVPRHRVEALRAGAGPIWLFGGIGNDGELWDLFDEVICLVADDATIRRRLADRTNNNFGKHPDELAAVLGWNPSQGQRYVRLGARVVDSSRPLAEVALDVAGRTMD